VRRFFAIVAIVGCITLAAIAAPQAQTNPAPPAAGNPAKPATGASDAEIAAAKASHKVWVNLDTGVYHSRGRWYGKTKNGKFMTVDEARKAGYKPSQRD
jgi:hypothetical protein